MKTNIYMVIEMGSRSSSIENESDIDSDIEMEMKIEIEIGIEIGIEIEMEIIKSSHLLTGSIVCHTLQNRFDVGERFSSREIHSYPNCNS